MTEKEQQYVEYLERRVMRAEAQDEFLARVVCWIASIIGILILIQCFTGNFLAK